MNRASLYDYMDELTPSLTQRGEEAVEAVMVALDQVEALDPPERLWVSISLASMVAMEICDATLVAAGAGLTRADLAAAAEGQTS